MEEWAKLADKIVDTDVLIIGSEGAGARAAIEAAKYNVKVAVTTKGFMAKSGATLTAGTDIDVDSKSIREVIGMEGDPRDSKKLFFEDVIIEGVYVNNQMILERHVEDAPIRVKELIDWGMKVWGPTLAPGHRYPRGIYSTGVEVMKALKSVVSKLKDKVQVIENTMVTDLLTDNGKIAGAVGLDILSGKFVVFRAKAVIMATGGAQRIYPYTTAPEELTGDGQAMAYRAGVALKDMEFVQFLTSTFAYPPVTTQSVNPYLVCGVWLLNNRGDRFMRHWDPEHLESSTRDVVAAAIMNEILEGRGWEDERGEYAYMSFRHLPENMIDDFSVKMFAGATWEGFWDEIKHNALPVFPASHFFCGGTKINKDCETELAGFYAAGECSAGTHGANRLSGNAVTQIVVQGALAGKNAAEYAMKAKTPQIDAAQLKSHRERVFAPLERKEGLSALELKRKIQRLCWDSITPVRHKNWLEEGLKGIEELKKQIPEICVRNKKRVYNMEWVDALQVPNMLLVAEMICRSALMRTESRGVHFRKDYPNTNNTKWLRNTVVKNMKGKMRLSTEPAVITKFRPPKGSKPWPTRW